MKKTSKFDMWMVAIFALSLLCVFASFITLMWTEDIFWLKMAVTFVGSTLLSFLAIRTT